MTNAFTLIDHYEMILQDKSIRKENIISGTLLCIPAIMFAYIQNSPANVFFVVYFWPDQNLVLQCR